MKQMSVIRNGVTLPLKPLKIKKGEDKDLEYPTIIVDEDNLDSVITFIGAKNVMDILQRTLNTKAQNFWKEAIHCATPMDSNEVNYRKAEETFLQMFSEFDARGEAIPQLQAQVDELVGKLLETEGPQKELKTRIKQLRLTIETKRRLSRKQFTQNLS